MKQKNLLLLAAWLLMCGIAQAQDAAAFITEAVKLEQVQKEPEAFQQYQHAAAADPKNIQAQLKLAELSTTIGGRLADPVEKAAAYKKAMAYADAARTIDSTNAMALAITAEVYSKMAEVEEKRDEYAEDIRQWKAYANQAVGANPNLGFANNVLGRWHLNLLTLNPIKKAALKLLGGKIPEANIDSSIAYFEKCKAAERYYCRNFLDLGKAYENKRQYEKAMDVLTQLSKLPTRRQDDPEIKREGAALLQKLN